MPDPTGKTPYTTPSGKPFEAGTRGFWFDYPNINRIVTDDLGLDQADVFTDFTNSSFYSPDGLEATAPVFSSGVNLFGARLPELPSPLGQVLATVELFERIPIADRASMVGLLYATLDFTRDAKTFEAYDRMNAHDLFVKMGLSKRLVDDFIRPTLLVGLFKPPEELSAAVTMELLYYYALAHSTSFDVRWIKSRSIAELIIAPLAERLAGYTLPAEAVPSSPLESDEPVAADTAEPALTVLGSSFVQKLDMEGGRVSALEYRDSQSGEVRRLDDLTGCVLALGSKGMKAVVGGSSALARSAPELCAAASLDAIDVIAVRLWLDTTVATRTPANVFSRFPALRGAGGTFFMLDQLQGNDAELWGGEEPQGSVVACDFYNAGALLPLSNDDIVELLTKSLLPAAVPGFRGATVVDAHVQRFPGAVSWFSPGSFLKRPPLETSIPNLKCAGDWVRMGEREHGAKGLCQERALVSGLEAANALARSGVLGDQRRREHDVLQVRDDEPQVVAGRAANKAVQELLGRVGLGSPWVR